MSIAHWPEAERPREKLLARGPEALSDAELLAIFLRTGVAGMDAVSLARHLLERFGGVRALVSAPLDEFCAVKGLGSAKFAQLQAVVELARRALAAEMREISAMTSPQAVRDYLRLSLQPEDREVFVVVYLDNQHRVIHNERLFSGTFNQTSVYPREVARRALRHNAAAVIFAHNHPSGVAEPSSADERITRTLKEALALFEIRVLDHFVVGHGSMTSMAERGLI